MQHAGTRYVGPSRGRVTATEDLLLSRPRADGADMAGGAYAALSGSAEPGLDQLDRLAADLANVGTAGYKAERVTTRARPNARRFGRARSRPSTSRRGPAGIDFQPGTMSRPGATSTSRSRAAASSWSTRRRARATRATGSSPGRADGTLDHGRRLRGAGRGRSDPAWPTGRGQRGRRWHGSALAA